MTHAADAASNADARTGAPIPPLVYAAAAGCFALGLVFIFVRAPHPYGWEGFDNYRALALGIARGDGFPTLEVPWGYPAFLAVFYRLFGDRQWIPLVAQVFLNALIPVMMYPLIAPRAGRRVAGLTSLLVAALSFNTVYASTQTSDCVCTVLIVAAVLMLDRGLESGRTRPFVVSGLLCGLALQMRPHFLLFAVWLAAVTWLFRRPRPSLRPLVLYVLTAGLVAVPWVARNLLISGRLIPATTHGGVQLWYGSLQTGEYFTHWFDNPRVTVGQPVFDVTDPSRRTLVVTAEPNTYFECGNTVPRSVALTYWTDRDPRPVVTPPRAPGRGGRVVFQVPPQPADTVLYYFFDASWVRAGTSLDQQRTPAAGPRDPFVHFISHDWFSDLDRHSELLDVFDVVRILRHLAWGEAIPLHDQVDLDRDGRITAADLNRAVAALLDTNPWYDEDMDPARLTMVSEVRHDDNRAVAVFKDGSTLAVPRRFSGRVQDLGVQGDLAVSVMRAHRSFAGMRLTPSEEPALAAIRQCELLDAGVDKIFYRAEPQAQDRYLSLALENISHAPLAFAAASARRVVGLFVVVGSDDRLRAHQFTGSGRTYAVANVLTASYLILFVAGVVLAWRRRLDMGLLLAAIVYVPVMIGAFLSSMRYSVSAQPFVFAFVALALVVAYDAVKARA